jgi:hypothetical protein
MKRWVVKERVVEREEIDDDVFFYGDFFLCCQHGFLMTWHTNK